MGGSSHGPRILADLSRRDAVKDGWVDIAHVVSMAGHKALRRAVCDALGGTSSPLTSGLGFNSQLVVVNNDKHSTTNDFHVG
jgi:hypothetical protein